MRLKRDARLVKLRAVEAWIERLLGEIPGDGEVTIWSGEPTSLTLGRGTGALVEIHVRVDMELRIVCTRGLEPFMAVPEADRAARMAVNLLVFDRFEVSAVERLARVAARAAR